MFNWGLGPEQRDDKQARNRHHRHAATRVLSGVKGGSPLPCAAL